MDKNGLPWQHNDTTDMFISHKQLHTRLSSHFTAYFELLECTLCIAICYALSSCSYISPQWISMIYSPYWLSLYHGNKCIITPRNQCNWHLLNHNETHFIQCVTTNTFTYGHVQFTPVYQYKSIKASCSDLLTTFPTINNIPLFTIKHVWGISGNKAWDQKGQLYYGNVV